MTRFPERAAYATAPALFAQLGNKTPDQWLVDTYVTEGIARLQRTPAGPACRANVKDAPDCKGKLALGEGACEGALYDADWISEGRMPFDQQHPAAPLRLTRRADMVAHDGAELDRLWEPRLAGAALTQGGFPLGPPLMAQVHMYSDPGGAHGFVGGACTLWDPAGVCDRPRGALPRDGRTTSSTSRDRAATSASSTTRVTSSSSYLFAGFAVSSVAAFCFGMTSV